MNNSTVSSETSDSRNNHEYKKTTDRSNEKRRTKKPANSEATIVSSSSSSLSAMSSNYSNLTISIETGVNDANCSTSGIYTGADQVSGKSSGQLVQTKPHSNETGSFKG